MCGAQCVICDYYRVCSCLKFDYNLNFVYSGSITNQAPSKRKKKRDFEVVLWLQLWRSCGFSFWYNVDDYVFVDCVKWDISLSRHSFEVLEQKSLSLAWMRGASSVDQSYNCVPCQSPLSFVANNHTYITPTQANSINYDCLCLQTYFLFHMFAGFVVRMRLP